MVLEQDRVQREESTLVEQELAYQKELKQYEKDTEEYNKALAKYNKAQADLKADKERKAEEERQAKIAYEKELEKYASGGGRNYLGQPASEEFERELRIARYEGNRNVESAILSLRRYQDTGGGRQTSLFRNRVHAALDGMSAQDFAKMAAEDERKRREHLAATRSFRLNAARSQQQSQEAEMERLDGGKLVGFDTKGRASTAPGTAQKSQGGFSNEFLTSSEIKEKQDAVNQAYLVSIGSNVDIKELNELGISTLYNSGGEVTGFSPPIAPVKPIKSTNTGSGTKEDPYKATQPQLHKVSPIIAPVETFPKQTGKVMESTNTGSGTKEDPYKAAQPKMNFVSPVLTQEETPRDRQWEKFDQRVAVISTRQEDIAKGKKPFLMTPHERNPNFAPTKVLIPTPKPEYQYEVTTEDGKVRKFDTLEHAQKFVSRITPEQQTTQQTISWELEYEGAKHSFATRELAEEFVKKKEMEKPLTYNRIPFVKEIYESTDKSARSWREDAINNPDDFNTQINAAGITIQAGFLNTLTIAGDLIDEHILKQPVKETRPVTIATQTYYDKGMESVTENIDITSQYPYVTGVPSLNPLDKGNVYSKWYEGAAKQWSEQTPAQNIAQSVAVTPVVAFDVATLGQGGAAVVRTTGSIAQKIVPKLVVRTGLGEKLTHAVTNAPIYGSKPNIAKVPKIVQKRKQTVSGEELVDRLKITPENPEPIGKSANFGDKVKPIQSQQADVKFSKEIKPNKNVKEDPNFKQEKVIAREVFDEDTKIAGFEKSKVELGEFEGIMTHQGKVRPRLENDYSKPPSWAEDLLRGTQPVDVGFKKTTVSTVSTGSIRKTTHTQPNYITAASDFVDFQNSLVRTPKRYEQVFTSQKIKLAPKYDPAFEIKQKAKGPGDFSAKQFRLFQEGISPSIKMGKPIKTSKGFIPNKYPTQKISKKVDKKIEEDPWYKPEKITDDMLTDSGKGGQPIHIGKTPTNKYTLRMPTSSKAPITPPKYIIGNAKTPKGGHAPIGYTKPEPKKISEWYKSTKSTDSKQKQVRDDLDDIISKENPTESGSTITIGKSETTQMQKKKQLPSQNPPDNWVEITYDTPIKNPPTTTRDTLLLPIVAVEKRQEKIIPRQVTSVRTVAAIKPIQNVKLSLTPIQNVKPKTDVKSSVFQSQKISQPQMTIQPQSITQKPKQTARQPSSPKPKTRVISKPIFNLKSPQRQVMPEPTPNRKVVLAAAVMPHREKKSTQKEKRRRTKRKDFLGNTRTDKIVGLFKRTEVITGDKKTAKQLKKDKKFKEGKKKKKTKKKIQSIMQKHGILNKGFKI